MTSSNVINLNLLLEGPDTVDTVDVIARLQKDYFKKITTVSILYGYCSDLVHLFVHGPNRFPEKMQNRLGSFCTTRIGSNSGFVGLPRNPYSGSGISLLQFSEVRFLGN